MSNSELVSYKNLTKNKTNNRAHKIDTITIHCYVGQVTAKQGCDYFANTDRQVSSNYVVGKDGSIGLSVDEKDRSWCSSNYANDHRAVTIEVASDTKHPYAVTDAAMKALIELVADICKRNGIKKLVWSKNKTDRVNHINGCNMTVHRDFAVKSCPGKYLYDRHGYIAEEVNKRLNPATVKVDYDKLAREVLAGKWGNGQDRKDRLGELYSEVQRRVNELVKGKTTQEEKLAVGDVVKLVKGATYADGKKIPLWVFACKLYVREFRNNNKEIIISTKKTGAITGVVKVGSVKKV